LIGKLNIRHSTYYAHSPEGFKVDIFLGNADIRRIRRSRRNIRRFIRRGTGGGILEHLISLQSLLNPFVSEKRGGRVSNSVDPAAVHGSHNRRS
jgi:hypothetical protein